MQPFYQCRVGYSVSDIDQLVSATFLEGGVKKIANCPGIFSHNVHLMLKIIKDETYMYVLGEVKEYDRFLPAQDFPYNFVLIIFGPCPERISKFMEDFQDNAKIKLHPAPESFSNQGEIISRMWAGKCLKTGSILLI